MGKIVKTGADDLGVLAGGSTPTMREIEMTREIVSKELGVKAVKELTIRHEAPTLSA